MAASTSPKAIRSSSSRARPEFRVVGQRATTKLRQVSSRAASSPRPNRSQRNAGLPRQTPRVSITIRRTALAKRRLGRSELKLFSEWNDGRPETELNFKFYRQATNKIVGISSKAAAFLGGFF